MQIQDSVHSSILIRGEQVIAVLDLPANKMAIALFGTDILVSSDWEITSRITDPDSGNVEKRYLFPLPSFDSETFPFILAPGEKSISLLNVKEHTMQTIV